VTRRRSPTPNVSRGFASGSPRLRRNCDGAGSSSNHQGRRYVLTVCRCGAVVDSMEHVLGRESTEIRERLRNCGEVEAAHASDTDPVVSDDRNVLWDPQIRILYRGNGANCCHVVRDKKGRGRIDDSASRAAAYPFASVSPPGTTRMCSVKPCWVIARR
jgi:hypothetical protein